MASLTTTTVPVGVLNARSPRPRAAVPASSVCRPSKYSPAATGSDDCFTERTNGPIGSEYSQVNSWSSQVEWVAGGAARASARLTSPTTSSPQTMAAVSDGCAWSTADADAPGAAPGVASALAHPASSSGTTSRPVRQRRVLTRCSFRWAAVGPASRGVAGDEGGVGDDVVQVVPGLGVELTATGDQPQRCVVGVAVDLQRRERVLGIGHDAVDGEDGCGAVGPGDGDLVAGAQVAEVEEHARPVLGGVHVPEQHRGAERAGGRGAGEPAGLGVPRQGRDLDGAVGVQPQVQQVGGDPDRRHLHVGGGGGGSTSPRAVGCCCPPGSTA